MIGRSVFTEDQLEPQRLDWFCDEEGFGSRSEQSAGSSAHLIRSFTHLGGTSSAANDERDADSCLISKPIEPRSESRP